MKIKTGIICLLAACCFTGTAIPDSFAAPVVKKKNVKKKKLEETAQPDTPEKSDTFALEIPYVSVYYIQPEVTDKDPVKISFYVTDWNQSEYRFNDKSHRFHAALKIRKKMPMNRLEGEEKVFELRDIPAGDHAFEVGTYPEGEYQIAIDAEDVHGRKSAVIFNEFRVCNKNVITEEETFRLEDRHYARLQIPMKEDPAIFHFLDVAEKDPKMSNTDFVKKAVDAGIKVPSGKYVVVAAAEKYNPAENSNHRGAKGGPVPEWLPTPWSWRSCKVLYADDYNHEQVEKDAVRTGRGLNQLLRVAKKQGFKKVVLQPRVYRISHTTTLLIPSGMTLDLNGATIKLNQFTGCKGLQVNLSDTYDSHVVNGIIEGDYFEHDYENSEKGSEWVCGIGIHGDSRYSSVERVLVRYITGYGVTSGFNQVNNHYATTFNIKYFEPGTLDEKTGEYLPDVPGMGVSDFFGVAGYLEDGGYIAISRFLGYQGMVGSDWSLRYHFFDDDKNYLETVYGRQYRRVRIPEKAAYARLTVYAFKDLPFDSDLTANLFKLPWNSWFKDIFVLSARCVGMAPSGMYNLRVENCSFVRSGENKAKCAFDAEDGWDMMQDVWFVRNWFYKNPVNEFVCCAGHNFVFEDNEASLLLWDRTNGYVVRNNQFRYATLRAGRTRARTGLVRISGNTYSKRVMIGSSPPKGDGEKPTEAEKEAEEALAAVNPDRHPPLPQVDQGDAKTQTKEVKMPPWFITMQDADQAEQVECGLNAALANVNLRGSKLGRISLLNGTLNDITNLRFADSAIVNSRVSNITGQLNRGTFTVSESVLRKVSVGMGPDSAVVIRNADLNKVTFKLGYWIPPVKLIFENCIIKNDSEPLITSGVYSVGEYRFVNCEIDTGAAPVVKIYDMRNISKAQNDTSGVDYDTLKGVISFEDCTITGRRNSVIDINDRNDQNKKPITVTEKNTEYKGDLVSREPVSWTVTKEKASARKTVGRKNDLPLRGRTQNQKD